MICITLKNPGEKKGILEKAKNLKEFQKVYIRKDVHPLVNHEFQRLKHVEKEEKENPENMGGNDHYDATSLIVYVDNKVIDMFKPTLF